MVPLVDRRLVERQWAAFASGVGRELSEEETEERARRRLWASNAARLASVQGERLRAVSTGLEAWADTTQEALAPLHLHVARCRARLQVAAGTLWPEARVEIFGSWAVGLHAPSSDVDLLVRGAPAGQATETSLGLLAGVLEHEDWLAHIHVLGKARVPLIKASAHLPPELHALAAGSGGCLALDISLEGRGHAGAATTAFTRDVLLAQLPPLRPLVLTLKQLLASRGLSDGYRGGLSSYALVLMAAALLQSHEAALGRRHALGVGAALLRFCELYGGPTEPPCPPGLLGEAHGLAHPPTAAALAVRLDEGSRLRATRVARALLDGAPLLVQDPLDTDNNVGSGAFNFHAIQRLLREVANRLEQGGDDERGGPATSPEELLQEVIGFVCGRQSDKGAQIERPQDL